MTEKCLENIAKNAAFEGGRGGALKCHGWKWDMGAKVCRYLGLGMGLKLELGMDVVGIKVEVVAEVGERMAGFGWGWS